MKHLLSKLVLIGFIFLLPLQSMAWGLLGHRIVGEIASKYLTKKARKEISKILGTESIAMSSNWADFIKSDSTYKYLDIWHYVNFEKGLSYEAVKEVLQKDTTVNAYTKINFLVSELKKKDLAMEQKKFYLRLLIHFVGDIHQPLHVSPVGTSGGNSIRVQWFSTPSNLHRVWDSHLIEDQQLSYTEYVKHINHTNSDQRRLLQEDPFSKWLYESYSIAQDLISGIKEENPRLGYRYNYDHLKTVEDQLLKGGVRLAGLLNEIFD
ncbi:MAG: S1/P1 nuclease [Flavisolibacter sp.]